MCQLTSPSLNMIVELPSAAGSSRTPTRTGRNSLRGPVTVAASVAAVSAGAATASDTRSCPRPLRRVAPVDEIEHDPDRLRREKEDLCTVRQANEQIKAAEDADDRHKGRD